MIPRPPFTRIALVALLLAAGCATAPEGSASPASASAGGPSADAPERPTPAGLADDLAEHALEQAPIGEHGRAVSHASPAAQAWFDQGLRWLYGFNQDQAAACFARAAQESPDCAMAWWGIAQAFAVDINHLAVAPHEAVAAEVAAHEAARLAASTDLTPIEAGLVAAAQIRAVTPAPAEDDRGHLDEAYLSAIAGLHRAHPGDPDLGFLHAEAMMLLQPWQYWTPDGEPVKRAEEIVAVIEDVLDDDPHHPGACHLYIHAVESSNDPGRAEAAADRLAPAVPRSGHLVHMPSHLYIHVGRYHDATEANLRAAGLDAEYFQRYREPTFYRVYFLHNLHFAAFGAMMEGRRALALEQIARMEEETPDALVRQYAAAFDGVAGSRLHVLIRFGLWEEILEVPPYADFRKASTTMRHYARAVALANLGRTAEARKELERFDRAAARTPEDWIIAFNPAHEIFDLARKVAKAEILWREGKPGEAIPLLEEAVQMEHVLTYTEPPPWMIPVRHTLGAIELASGDAAAAERTFLADLKANPENAWALLGLHQALMAQGKHAAAADLKPRVDAALQHADVEIPASCYCGVDLAAAAGL